MHKIDSLSDLVENLAVMTAKGFEGVNHRLDKVEKEVSHLGDKLEYTNRRIDNLAETKASKESFSELESRVVILENK